MGIEYGLAKFYNNESSGWVHIMTTATIWVFLLSCIQAKYELGILPKLRPHVRSHIPGKVA